MEEDFNYCSKEKADEFINEYLDSISYDIQSGNSFDLGFIYLIDFGDGKTKIGFTKLDPRKRLKQLSTTSTIMPFELSLVALGYCMQVRCVEKILHTEFRQFRHSGEWFDFSDKKISAMKLHLVERLNALSRSSWLCEGWEKWKPDDEYIKIYENCPNWDTISGMIDWQKNPNKSQETTNKWIKSLKEYAF